MTTARSGWRKALLSVHVLASVGAFGADLTLLVLGVASVLGIDPRSVYPAADLVARLLVQPLATVSLLTGVSLGLVTPWGLLRYWWTAIKLAITLALSAVVVLVLVPRLGAASVLATTSGPASFAAGDRIPLMLAPVVGSSLLALNVVLAVYKPSWRLRGAPARVRAARPGLA